MGNTSFGQSSGPPPITFEVATPAVLQTLSARPGSIVQAKLPEGSWTLRFTGGSFLQDGVNFVDSILSGYQWERGGPPPALYVSQLNWYIDPSAGDDQNAGDGLGVPLKTLAEWFRRTGGAYGYGGGTTTIHLISNTTERFNFPLRGLETTSGLLLVGEALTPVDTDTVFSATQIDPATNGDATLVGTLIVGWGPYIDKWIVANGGTHFARILAELVPGTAILTPWTDAAGIPTTAPAAASPFDVVDLVQLSEFSPSGAFFPNTINLNFLQILTPSPIPDGIYVFTHCSLFVALTSGSLVALGCGFDTLTVLGGLATIVGCGGYNWVMDGTGILVAVFSYVYDRAGGTPALNMGNALGPASGGNSGQLVIADGGLGLSHSTLSDGLHVHGSHVSVTSTGLLWGSDNAVGVSLLSGATLDINPAAVPNLFLTGTIEVNLEGNSDCVPGSAPGTAIVMDDVTAGSPGSITWPSSGGAAGGFPLTTWAEWAAAPFNGFAFVGTTGSKIISGPA